MKKMKLVLVGNGMAGVRTLEELIKLEPELYDITVFGSEPYPNSNDFSDCTGLPEAMRYFSPLRSCA